MTLSNFLSGVGSRLRKSPQSLFAVLFLLIGCSTNEPGSIAGTLVFPGGTGNTELGEIQQPKTSTPAFVPGEVIVSFSSDVKLQSLSVHGLSLQRAQAVGLPRTALYRTEGLDEQETLALVDTLNARPDVEYAEPNYIKTILKTPNDELYPYQWHYEAMNLPAAWDISDGTDEEVTVAVVDSGSVAHPDMQGVWLGGYDFISNPEDSGDGDGYDADPTDLGEASFYHGTHVAGTIAAKTNNGSGVAGVSWGARVLSVRVLGVTGAGTLSDTVNGILWAAGESVSGVPINPNPAQVINLSLGGEAPCSQLEQNALNTVRAKGITVVVAAGNSDVNANTFSPASCSGVITVGATGPKGKRAPYSNYGTKVDLMAPGGDASQTLNLGGQEVPAGVFSTLKDDEDNFSFGFYQGTSMAAPHVSGLVALLLSQEPELGPDAILARLQASATPLSERACGRARGGECGAGLVDASAALGGEARAAPPLETSPVKAHVLALYCTAACSDFDVERSSGDSFVMDTLEKPFQIGGLGRGTYLLVAWQDLDDDARPDDGEPLGRHASFVTLKPGEALTGKDIHVQAFTTVDSADASDTLSTNNALISRAAKVLLKQ